MRKENYFWSTKKVCFIFRDYFLLDFFQKKEKLTQQALFIYLV